MSAQCSVCVSAMVAMPCLFCLSCPAVSCSGFPPPGMLSQSKIFGSPASTLTSQWSDLTPVIYHGTVPPSVPCAFTVLNREPTVESPCQPCDHQQGQTNTHQSSASEYQSICAEQGALGASLGRQPWCALSPWDEAIERDSFLENHSCCREHLPE